MDESGGRDKPSVIVSLLRFPFRHRTLVERDEIIRAGRPTPPIKTLKSTELNSKESYTRNFNTKWYITCSWLTGCNTENKLYCWPCLLMCKRKFLWNDTGINDYKNLTSVSKHHSKSKIHLLSQLSWKKWERSLSSRKNNILSANNSQSGQDEYNAIVKLNRELMRGLVDFTSLLCGQHSVFAVCVEGEPTLNKKNFEKGFLSFIKHNNELSEHCRKLGNSFSLLVETVQSDILECTVDEMTEMIRNELNEARFFSILVDDVTDISIKSQCSIIVRFVDTNGDIKEIFYGFYDVDSVKTAANLSAVLERLFDKGLLRDKLVAISCCGMSVTANELIFLKDRIGYVAPQSLYIHFTASHRLDGILEQSAMCSIKETSELFATMRGLPNFLRRSTNVSEALTRIISERIPSHVELTWNSNSKLFAFVLERKEILTEIFNDLIDAPDSSSDIKRQACAFKNGLSGFRNLFLLIVYQDIFSKIDSLNDALHLQILDVDDSYSILFQVIDTLKRCRSPEQMGIYLAETESRCAVECPGVHDDDFSKIGLKYTTLFDKILDNVLLVLETRILRIRKLRFLELVNNSKFQTYEANFPNNAFRSLKNIYGKCFDFDRLKNELEIFYTDRDFYERSVPYTLKLITVGDLTEVYQEIYKLYSLAATMPFIVPPQERNFPCLEKVKTFLRSVNIQYGTSAGLIYIESKLLSQAESKDTWHDAIIKRFSEKSNKLDLDYKS